MSELPLVGELFGLQVFRALFPTIGARGGETRFWGQGGLAAHGDR